MFIRSNPISKNVLVDPLGRFMHFFTVSTLIRWAMLRDGRSTRKNRKRQGDDRYIKKYSFHDNLFS